MSETDTNPSPEVAAALYGPDGQPHTIHGGDTGVPPYASTPGEVAANLLRVGHVVRNEISVDKDAGTFVHHFARVVGYDSFGKPVNEGGDFEGRLSTPQPVLDGPVPKLDPAGQPLKDASGRDVAEFVPLLDEDGNPVMTAGGHPDPSTLSEGQHPYPLP